MKLLERVVFEACDSACYDLVFVVELPPSSLAHREDTLAIHRTTSVSSNIHPVLLRPSSDIFIRLEAQNRGLWFPFLFLPHLLPDSYEKPSGGILKDGLFPYLFLRKRGRTEEAASRE